MFKTGRASAMTALQSGSLRERVGMIGRFEKHCFVSPHPLFDGAIFFMNDVQLRILAFLNLMHDHPFHSKVSL